MKQLYKYILTLVAILMVTNLSAQNPNYQGGTWYSLYDATEYKNEDNTFSVFSPTTGSLSFQWKKTGRFIGYPIYKLYVSESSNGLNYTEKYFLNSGTGTKQDSYVSVTTTVSENITRLKFEHDGGSLDRFYKDVKLPLAKHILLNDNTSNGQTWGVSSITLTDNSLATAEGQTSSTAYTIQFRSFLASGNISIESNNPEFHFGKDANGNPVTKIWLGTKDKLCASQSYTGNPGDYWQSRDNFKREIYFSPSVKYKKDTRSTTITITDGTSTAYIYLSAPVIPTYFFKAEAISSPAEGGTATATFANGQSTYSIIAPDYATGILSTTVTFTAAPKTADGYVFEGWKTDPASSTFYKQGADQTTITETITSSALNPNGLASQLTLYAIYSRRYTAKITGSNYTNRLVNDSLKADYQFINTQTAIPTNSEADPFYFKIDHDFTGNDTREDSPRPDEVIAYNPTTNTITALNEGTATITFYQKNTSSHEPVTESFTVQVIKHTPKFTWNAANITYYYGTSIPNIFSTTNPDCQYTIVSDNEHVAKVIDNTLHIYNVEETANITITQAENYKWNGKTETYTITPVKQNNHVEFTITNDNHTIFEESFTSEAEWNGSAYRFGDGGWTSRTDEVVISFTGIPDTLYFDKTLEKSVGQLPGTHKCEVYESPNGNDWKLVWENDVREENTNGNKASLSPTTKYIKFYYYGTVFANYKNIRVTERREFTAIPDTTVDFGVQGLNYGEQDTLITFNHINAGRITKVELIGADTSYFTVNPTTIPNTGRDQYGTTYLNITFDNKKTDRGQSPYNAALRIYDNNGREEIVPLTGKRYGKSYPRFKWNSNGLPYYINSSIVNIATSSNTDYTNCPLTYTTSDPTIAKVENGVLYIYDKEQEVTITVSQNGNNDFYAGSSKLTFTPRRRPELVVPFHVTKDIYEKSVNPVYQCSWNETESAIQLGQNSSIIEAPAWDWNAKTALITFDGVPGKLSFKHRAINGLSTNAIWLVEQSADGYEWDEVYRETSSSTSYTNVNDIELDENTRYLRFSFSGNFGGYIKDINVSELVGYKYLRAADGHYLSRGAKYGTQAVVDAFGVVSRISRYTEDNENIYTRFFFVDNEQYMFETETADAQRLHEVFTDHGTADNTNHLWQINNNGGILTIQSANDVGVSHKGNYITAVNGVLAFTTNEAEAIKWQMEDYTEHPQYIADMLNRQAAAAAVKDFGRDVNTLEKVRNRLKEEDFEIHEITIPELKLGEQTGESRTLEGMPQIYEQTIPGLETGFYRLTVKAFYRISNSEIAWKCYQEKGKESVLAYAYANDVQYPIQSVYASYHSSAIENTDELRDGKYYSTTLSSANVAFNDANRYLNDVYVYVEADPGKTTGTLRYGIKCPSYVPGAWLAYSTITLTRFGRQEYVFKGTSTSAPTDWNTKENWNKGAVPNQYHIVTIEAPVNISTPVEVYGISVVEGNTIKITSTGGLTVGQGGVTNAATNGSSIVIDNTPEGVGFLRIHPNALQKPAKAQVNFTTRGRITNDDYLDAAWQYIGAPGRGTNMGNLKYNSLLYLWSEVEGWSYQNSDNVRLEAFKGYAITQESQPDFTLYPELIFDDEVTIQLTYTNTQNGMKGDNLWANSYLAPLDVTKFTPEDLTGNITKTFYVYNSGSWKEWDAGVKDGNSADGGDTPGRYYAIPAFSSRAFVAEDQTVIPPMQGVYMVAGEGGGSITLNYQKHVWNNVQTNQMNRPVRVVSRKDNIEQPYDIQRVRLQITSENSGADRMYVIQDSFTTGEYDNGYDAPKQMADNLVNIYTSESFGKMEVSATDNMDGMYIGFKAGSDTEYTMNFTALIEEPFYLYDSEEDTYVEMTEQGEYQFNAIPYSTNDLRFQVLMAPELPEDGPTQGGGIATDVEDLAQKTKLWVSGKKVYVQNAPQNSILAVYTVSGICVTASYTINHTPCTIDLSYLPTGVYVIRLNNQAYKFVCK